MNEMTMGFLRVLNPDDHAAGGGTASAIAGSMASALVAMVARLSITPDAPLPEESYRRISEEATDLSKRLLLGGDEDSRAFSAILAAYRLPKESELDRRARTAAIQQSTTGAAEVPMVNAESCARVLELVTELRGRSNPRAASDLECAGYLAHAGLLGCVANVQTNLPSIKDHAVVAELRRRIQNLPASTQPQA